MEDNVGLVWNAEYLRFYVVCVCVACVRERSQFPGDTEEDPETPQPPSGPIIETEMPPPPEYGEVLITTLLLSVKLTFIIILSF
jgi:hypothetical protein